MPKSIHCGISQGRGSFTLIEVVMAFMLTAVSITAAVGLMTSTMWGTNYMEHRLTASNLAQSRIEHIRSLPFNELPAMIEDAVKVNGRGLTDANGQYERTTEVGSVFMSTRAITVTVTSTWKKDVDALSVSLTTIALDPNAVVF